MSEWISVKDDLPKKEDCYLVKAPGYYGKNHICNDISYSTFQPNYKKPWAIERGGYRSWIDWKITHWMPIPK